MVLIVIPFVGLLHVVPGVGAREDVGIPYGSGVFVRQAAFIVLGLQVQVHRVFQDRLWPSGRIQVQELWVSIVQGVFRFCC